MDADYFKDLICYIHHNPIHHFGADFYHEWAYSSYDAYRNVNEYPFLDTAVATNRFGSKESLLAYHDAYRTKKQFAVFERVVMDYYN